MLGSHNRRTPTLSARSLYRTSSRSRRLPPRTLNLEVLEDRTLLSFVSATSFAAGSQPIGLVVADFNGDGKADLAAANYGTNAVAVMLGNGDGSFQSPVGYAVDQSPEGLTVGDFNGDGKPDLATANYQGGSLSVLLNTGTGTFGTAVKYTTGSGPTATAAGDLNHDGFTDLVTADNLNNTVSVFLGDGHGGFGSALSFAAGAHPTGLALGDFNEDGFLDVAVTNGTASTLSVLLGNGNGTLQAPVVYGTGNGPDALATADLNGDGHKDLIVTNVSSNTFQVFLGQGNGTFASPATYATDAYPQAVKVADVNGDGRLDVAVANTNSADAQVFLGQSDGSFQQNATYPLDSGPNSLVASDLNGDGSTDLATVSFNSNNGDVLLNAGNGALRAARSYPAGATPPFHILAQDWNRDGFPDLAVTNRTGSAVTILLSNGDGTFTTLPSFSTGNGSAPEGLATADFNGDGIPDLVTANTGANQLAIFLGNGDGTFGAPTMFAVGHHPNDVTVGDFNGDHLPDLATGDNSSNTVSVLLNTGHGGFQPAVAYATTANPGAIVTADFNHDNRADLAVVCSDNTVNVFLGQGDGTFPNRTVFAARSIPADLVVADLNTDGNPDLVESDYGGNSVSVLLGNSEGTFQPFIYTFTGAAYPGGIAVADFNGDGKPDVVVGSFTSGSISFLAGKGDGGFQAPVLYPAGNSPTYVAAGDFDGDGHLDVAAAASGGGGAAVYLQADPATHAQALTVSGLSVVQAGVSASFTVAAVDNHGRVMPNYRGTVHFQSSDPHATLPPDYPFTAADQGQHVFHATFLAVGLQSLEVSDGQLSGSADEIAVNSPNFTVQGTSLSSLEGNPFSATTGLFTHANDGTTAASYTVGIDWGDSTTSSGAVVDRGGGAFQISGSHTYVEEGSYRLTMHVTDTAGNQAFFFSTADVADAPLSARGRAVAGSEGSSTGVVTAATFVDFGGPESVGDYHATIAWGDGVTDTGTIVANSNGSFSVEGSHSYADNGSYMIAAHITNDNGTTADTTSTATIANVAPTVGISGPVDGVPGQSRSFSFSAADPSSADQPAGFTFSIAWGDGTTSTASGPSPQSLSHAYTARGSYTISVTATDKDGGTSAAATQTVTVVLAELQGGDLAVGGTPGNDSFIYAPGTNAGDVVVTRNGTALGTFHSTGAINTYGGGGTDTVVVNGTAGADSFGILAGGLTLNGVAYNGAGVEKWQANGQGGNDTFTVAAGGAATIDGGIGTDTLIGADGTNAWVLTAAGAGTLNGASFLNLENLTGGAGTDSFKIKPGGSVAGTINGGSGTADKLDFSLYGTAVTVNLQTRTAPGMGHFANLEVLTGSTATDTLQGANVASTWQITANNAGKVGSYSFSSFEDLTGGSANDTFTLSNGKGVAGTIDGGGGMNTLNYAAYTTAVAVTLADSGLSGATNITGGIANIQNVTGGAGNDTLTGNSADNILLGGAGNDVLSGGPAGNDILVGGAGNDALTGGAGRSLLLGGGGADTLTGGGNDDVLIAGTTSYDTNTTALLALLSEWKRTDEDYVTRIINLRNGVGPGNSFKLTSTTVHNDTSVDGLTGGPGLDWFWGSLSEITDLQTGEQVN
jgi:hypothetical protein